MTVDFEVLSSDGSTIYVVSVERQGDKVLASCTCKAGDFGQLCKHQIGMLSGQDDLLASSDEKVRMRLREVVSQIADTECASYVTEYLSAVAGLDEQKKRRDRAKRNLEKTLKQYL
jgi:uncharacterized Zn finger protein